MPKMANPFNTNTMKTRAFLVFTAAMTTVTWTPGVDAAVRSQGNLTGYWDGNMWQHREDEAVHQGVGSLQLHLSSPLISLRDGLLDDHSGGSGNAVPPEQDELQHEALRAAGIGGGSNSTAPGAHLPQQHQQPPVVESGGPAPASSSTLFFYNSTPAAIGSPGYDQPTAAGHANTGFLAPRGGSSSTVQPLHPPPQLEAPTQQRHTLPPAQNREQQLQQVLGGFNGMRVAPDLGIARRDRDPILSIFEDDDDDIAATSDSPSRTTSARATCGWTDVRFRAPPSTESSREVPDWNSEETWFLGSSDGSQDGRRVRNQNQPGGRVVAPLSTGSVDSTQAVIDFPVWRDNKNLAHLREQAGRGQHGGNDAEYQHHDTSFPPGFRRLH